MSKCSIFLYLDHIANDQNISYISIPISQFLAKKDEFYIRIYLLQISNGFDKVQILAIEMYVSGLE